MHTALTGAGRLTLQDVDPTAGEALLEFRDWAVEQFGSVPRWHVLQPIQLVKLKLHTLFIRYMKYNYLFILPTLQVTE